ncbi:hypothetical protein Vretifemale_13233, partial [Volvox reticuliferus]
VSAAPGTAAAPGSGAATGATGGGGIMQINSRAGYYTSKSPSMHLHEWVQKMKRRKAFYHPRQLEDGRWICKVVLPDEKRREDDIVVLLDEKYGAEDEQQARERGAVAALHRVQGDRALERILPKEFVSMWTELGEQRKEREQRVAERRASEARRKQGEEERRRKAMLRKPQVVVMSEAKQRLVQALLRDRARAGPALTPGSVGSDEGDLTAVVDQLSAMGFSPQHVQLAYERCASTSGGSGGAAGLEVLLDWLLVHLPSDQLPEQFTQGSGTNTVNIVARSEPGLQSVARLMSYGFTSAECEGALRAAGGDELRAHLRLYDDLTGVQLQGRPGDGGNGDAWAEEMMVLESIYDSQFSVVSENAVRLSLDLPEDCSVATRADAPLVLEFVRLSRGGDGEGDGGGAEVSYPDVAPLVSVSCAGLAAGALRHLTCVLAQESQQLLGQPALHDLAVRALAEAATMDEQTCTAAEAGSRAVAAAVGGAAAEWEDAAAVDGDGESNEWGLEPQDSSLVEGFEGLTVDDEEDEEGDGTASERRSGNARGRARGGSGGARQAPQDHRRRQRSQIDVAAESARLARLQSDIESSAVHAVMRAVRRALPAFAKRGQLLELLAGNDVVVVSGATGCGKSTQVPQYILEDAISSGVGAKCNIVVTQPRRISALGLASRVASERGESVGNVVGYSVRLEHRVSAATRLTFVTTGILLRRLLSDPDLEGTTHIVLDEVHERSIEIDLLLLLLRDVLVRRRTAAAAAASPPPAPPLKLILMSATADAKLFADYMTPTAATTAAVVGHKRSGGNSRRDGTASATAAANDAAADACGKSSVASVGMMTIPGFTYPVREFYLEDAFELTGHVVGQSSKYARRGGGGGGKGQRSGKGEAAPSLPALSQALPSYSQSTLRSLENVDESQVNYDLLVDLVAHIIERHKQDGAAAFLSDWPQAFSSGRGDVSGGGAILVFLPGAPEISKMQRMLLQSGKVLAAAGGRGNLRVLPLHGSLSSADQSRVFARPPAGCFKVVLSTNVAETSITIDDVTVVVDAGRVKEMSHDPERGIMRLQEVWVSQAAAQQRRGRAGRVRPGICFRLFSTQQWGLMPNHTEPEMLRSPLESVCLLVKGMTTAAAAAEAGAGAGAANGGVNAFLSRCLSPPSSKAVTSAVQLLRAIGAFDGDEALTSLGRHLNKMPMDPRVGKALVYGCMLGCLDPVLTVTAAMAHGRPVFLNLQNAEDGVASARRQLLRAVAASKSDHLAVVAAYNAWCKAVDKGGRSSGATLCEECGLSESSLESIQAGRAEYARVLEELGFLSDSGGATDPRVATGAAACRGPASSLPGSAWLAAPANRNAANARFVKASLCAGFYPSVLRVQHPPTKYKEVHGGTEEADADPRDVKFFDRARGRVFIHPGSLLFTVGKFESGWLVYTQMTETSKLFVREASMVPVYGMLLFGGEITMEHATGRLWVDGWAEFKASAQVGVMVRQLRDEMDRLLGAKISDPELPLEADPLVVAVEQLLSSDGF